MNSPIAWPLLLPAGLRNARALCRRVAARALAPEPVLTVSTWADENRVLSSKASGEPGRWQTSRTPYLREIMDALSMSHPCKDAIFMKGTQIGGSEAMYNAIGYIADRVPCPVMLVMPTTDGGKKISRQRLAPMIEETPVLRDKFSDAKSRDSSNTMLMKDFPGGLLVITGANSGPGLRNMPMRVVLQDEIDAYPDDVDGEGDPVQVADKRTDQFSARAKRFKCSTPKIKGKSRIARRFEEGTQGRYYLPCPQCRREQVLRWEQMRWRLMERRELVCVECGGVSEIRGGLDGESCEHCGARPVLTEQNTRTVNTDEVERAWYECEACGGEIHEHSKTWMLEHGRFIHAAPGAGAVLADDDPDPHAIWAWMRGKVVRFLPRFVKALSWHVPSLYSPLGWKSWFDCVAEWIKAEQGGYDEESGESLLQVFYNTVRGEPYEVPGEQPKVNLVKKRVEAYALGQVPAGALLLSAGVDVQGDRLEVEIDAFGRGEECWLVDYQVIHGDPLKRGAGSVWEALIELRNKAYEHAGGQSVRISAMAVDSGYLTQEVYDFCRTWSHKHVFATKGDNIGGKPVLSRPALVDINHHGKKIKRGVQLFHVGADTAKERLYRRLDLGIDPKSGAVLETAGPGYQHFPRGLPDEYFDGLVSEKLHRRMVRGVEKHEWIKTRERNEPLDTKILCYAAAIYAGMQRVNWDQLEQIINPTQRDIFTPPPTSPQPSPASGEGDKSNAESDEDVAAATAVVEKIAAPRRPAVPRNNWVTGYR